MQEKTNYITPAGFAALRAEYDRLLGDERPKTLSLMARRSTCVEP